MLFTSLDFDRPGKQHGHLQVPYSHNLGGWANVMIPVTVVVNGSGPTVLILAGNHGDEYQGQIAIARLTRELMPEQVRGRIILVSPLNAPAAWNASRLSPIDGSNLNRAFPGDPNGSVTSQVAHYLTTVLFPLSDVVVDIHSGGRSMEFVPCAHMHLVPDREQRRRMLDALLSWNTDFGFLYADIAGSGLLPVEAENQGKLVITTELGGGEGVPARVHRITQSGLRNVLIHLGVLQGEFRTRAAMGLPATILTQALDRDDYLLAPVSGVFEIGVDLGTTIHRGETIGWMHDLERPQLAPEAIVARSSGYLITQRVPCLTRQGDCVAVIAREISVDEVLAA